MTKPRYKEAQIWARNYAQDIAPRMAELKAISYEAEDLYAMMRIKEGPKGYDVRGLPALGLMRLSEEDPNAFDLMRKIIAENRKHEVGIPEVWKEFEANNTLGLLKRPKKPGPTKGADDLVYLIMADKLCNVYGLNLHAIDILSAGMPTACEVIFKEMRDVGVYIQSPAALEKRIRRTR